MPVYRKLAEHENIAAVKEASGDVSLSAAILAELSDSLSVYSGNDDLTLPILSLGGAGVISVLSNIMPREMHELCKTFFDGNFLPLGYSAQPLRHHAGDVLRGESHPDKNRLRRDGIMLSFHAASLV